ncbi:MAG: hypothetical protein ABSG25_08405 [Bryobacteraceae bacterium]
MTQRTGTNTAPPEVIEAIKDAVRVHLKGQTALAVQQLSSLVAQFPNLTIIHSYLGWLLSESGQPNKAIEHARQATLLSPFSEKASLVLFTVLWEAGQRTQALDEMKRVVAIGTSKAYSDLVDQMEQIMSKEGDNSVTNNSVTN